MISPKDRSAALTFTKKQNYAKISKSCSFKS